DSARRFISGRSHCRVGLAPPFSHIAISGMPDMSDMNINETSVGKPHPTISAENLSGFIPSDLFLRIQS
ncbi:hypothetical protein QUF80_05495, partial [Desulfococcaceae bacterium HSG8]|nr:hypothetical protein [Desulfococcaceae bacterium HSG8]